MPNINLLFQKPVEATLTIEGVEIAVSYNPSALSVNDYRRVMRLAEGGDQDAVEAGDDIATVLSHTLHSWDMTDDRGPIGTDVESLRDQPPVVIGAVLAGIFEDMAPKEPTSSAPRSSAAEKKDSASTPTTPGPKS